MYPSSYGGIVGVMVSIERQISFALGRI